MTQSLYYLDIKPEILSHRGELAVAEKVLGVWKLVCF